ncbi:MAG: iron-containing alcohol dehydrogenase [Hungatella hathewayi]
MADVFMAPGRIVSGVDALGGAADAIRELGEKALIVTDGMMRKLGNLDRLTNMLEASGIRYAVEDGITGVPDDGMILH